MFGIAIALAASVSWGLADFFGGLFSRRLPVLSVLGMIEIAGLVGVLAVVAIARPAVPSAGDMVGAVVAGAAGVTALGVFYRALAIGSMSIVAPISATGAMIPVVVGIAGGDTLTLLIGAGLAVTFTGILLASWEAEEEVKARAISRASIGLALLAAVGFGLFFTLFKPAAEHSVIWASFAVRLVAVLLVGAVMLITSTPPAGGGDGVKLFLVGQLDLGATLLIGLASTKADLAVVAVIGSLYPVVTVLLARGVLGERMRAIQLAGIACALTGVAMVSLGSA